MCKTSCMPKFRILLFFGVSSVLLAQSAGLDDARALFAEGQDRLKAGQPGMAKVTFETLIAVYPECSLVDRAKEAIREAEEQEPKAPVVRALRFENFKKAMIDRILDRLKEREVALAVETPLDPRELEDARKVIEQLLAEDGVAKRNVLVATRELAPQRVAVTFRLVKE